MASTTFTVLTPAITGTTITASAAVASSQTVTISPSTAQSILECKTLFVRVENQSTTASVTLTLGAGTRFSEIGQGAATITLATAATVIIGGQDLESARFQITAGTIVFTQAGTGPTSWEAYQAPQASE